MPDSSTLRKKLKQYGKIWKRTKPAPPMGGDLPDGNYIGKCISLTVNTSKASDRLQVSEKWKIVKPSKHKGRYLFAHIGLEGKNDDETEIAMGFAKQRYEVMGDLPEGDMTEIQDALDAIVDKEHGTLWKLAAKTKNDFQNLFLNGVSEGETADDDDDDDDDKKKSDDDDDDDDDKKKKSDDDDDDDDDDKKKKSDDDDDEEEYQRERRRKREKERERSRR